MKVLKFGLIGILAIGLWASCGTSASVVGTAGYGYYDDLYYYGHPGYFSGPVYIQERPIILNRVIQVPAEKENRRVIRRERIRSRSSESNRSRIISPAQERQIRQGTSVQKRSSSVATPSRGNGTRDTSPKSRERKP